MRTSLRAFRLIKGQRETNMAISTRPIRLVIFESQRRLYFITSLS